MKNGLQKLFMWIGSSDALTKVLIYTAFLIAILSVVLRMFYAVPASEMTITVPSGVDTTISP